MSESKYPEIEVQLPVNLFYTTLEIVTSALRRAGISEQEVLEFRDEAMDNELCDVNGVAARWVSVS